MIKSMTAFSQATHTNTSITADVTIRSYNSRHLDMVLHCPESCQALEDDIKKSLNGIDKNQLNEIKRLLENKYAVKKERTNITRY